MPLGNQSKSTPFVISIVQIIRSIRQGSFMKALIIKAVRPPQPFLTVTPLGLVLTGGNTVAENILRNGQRKLCDENTP